VSDKYDDNLIPTPWRLKSQLLLRKMPFLMIALILVLVASTFVPLAWIARYRAVTHREPRVHLFFDMDHQPKYKAQSESEVFADLRAARPPVEGTVARGRLKLDDHRHRGYELTPKDEPGGAEGEMEVRYFSGFPERIEVDSRLLQRGQTMFTTYCFPCHGVNGRGNGPVNETATVLTETGEHGTSWVPPSNLVATLEDGTLQYGPENYPEGKLFHVITHGIRNMAGYGSQIRVDDRWAVVAYVRALQLSQHASLEDVPEEKLDALK